MQGNSKTDRRGSLNPNYKDGRKNTRLYRIWNNIKSRCYNLHFSQYKNYGGRGISVCDEWRDNFQAFDELTIDRIDNNGNYTPENCRWVNNECQSNNRRNNHIVAIGNATKTLAEWCKIYNINYQTVQDRIRRGWSEFDSLTKPICTKFKKKVMP